MGPNVAGIAKSTVAIVLMVAGCLEFPCRIGNGILLDRGIMTATQQCTLSIFLAGLHVLLCAIISNLPGLLEAYWKYVMCRSSASSLNMSNIYLNNALGFIVYIVFV